MSWTRHRYFKVPGYGVVCTEMDSTKTCYYGKCQEEYALAIALERIEELEEKLKLPLKDRTAGPHLEKQYGNEDEESDPDADCDGHPDDYADGTHD